MGLIAPPNAGASLLVDPHNRPITSSAPPAPQPPKIPDRAFLCRAHGRFFARRKVPNDTIRDALVVVLLRSQKLKAVIGKAERDGITFTQIVAALEQVRPWCCYLSAPERAEVVHIGTKGHAYVAAQFEGLRERAFQRDLVRRSEALASEYHVSVDVAAYALEVLGAKGDGVARAAVASLNGLSPDEARAAIDALAAQL